MIEDGNGRCIICGSETPDCRGDTWLCLHDSGEGLACYEVWRNRIDRGSLPSFDEFEERYGGDYSTDPYAYDAAQVPWRDERDEYNDYKSYIQSREWNIKAWRAKVLTNWTCERCGRRGSFPSLHVHHKHYKTLYKERRQDVEVLCGSCHGNHHNKGGR